MSVTFLTWLARFPFTDLLLFLICPLLLETITDIFSVYVFLTAVPLS